MKKNSKLNNYLKEFIHYVSLNILGMVGISCYALADTFFITKGMGINGLTALNLCIPVYSIIYGTGLMLGVGGATQYTISKERGDTFAGKRIFTHVLILAFCFSALFFVIGVFFSRPIAYLLGADGITIDMCNTYLSVLLMFGPAFILNSVVLSFLRNDGAPGLAMLGMIIGSLSNILLDWVFIFPLGMGIFGAILATGLSPVISLVIYFPYFIMKKNGFGIGKIKISVKIIGKTLFIGFPAMLNELSTGIVTFIFNIIILKISGNIGVASYGIIANISVVIFAIFNGISQGSQPLISRLYAFGDNYGIKKTIFYALFLIVFLATSMYLVLFFGSDLIVSIFNTEGNSMLQSLAVKGLKLYFIGIFFIGINLFVSGFFASMEKALPSHFITIARGFIVIIPCAFLMSNLLKMTGLWLAFPISEMFVFVISIVLVIIYLKKRIKRSYNNPMKILAFFI